MKDEQTLPIPQTSLEKILRPINRLTESCVLKIKEDLLYTVCSAADNSVILYARTELPSKFEDARFNIINIKKFLTGLDCLGNEGNFTFTVQKNNIVCRSSNPTTGENTQFKYHLVDDHIIKQASVNVENICKLDFDTEFEISVAKIKQIMSAYTFVNDIHKIYFHTKDGKVYGNIDDQTQDNVDNVSLLIAPTFDGEDIPATSIKIELFKNLASYKNPIRVKINSKLKVFVFSIMEDDHTELKYIVSGLVK